MSQEYEYENMREEHPCPVRYPVYLASLYSSERTEEVYSVSKDRKLTYLGHLNVMQELV